MLAPPAAAVLSSSSVASSLAVPGPVTRPGDFYRPGTRCLASPGPVTHPGAATPSGIHHPAVPISGPVTRLQAVTPSGTCHPAVPGPVPGPVICLEAVTWILPDPSFVRCPIFHAGFFTRWCPLTFPDTASFRFSGIYSGCIAFPLSSADYNGL